MQKREKNNNSSDLNGIHIPCCSYAQQLVLGRLNETDKLLTLLALLICYYFFN
jgi:hypothetical protein